MGWLCSNKTSFTKAGSGSDLAWWPVVCPPPDLIHWWQLPGETVEQLEAPSEVPGKTVAIPSYVCPKRGTEQLHSREDEPVPPNEPLQGLVSSGKETLFPSPSYQRPPPPSAFMVWPPRHCSMPLLLPPSCLIAQVSLFPMPLPNRLS